MAESIQDTLTRLTAFVTQNYINADTGPGSVLNELLLKMAASLQNQPYNQVATLSQGNSIASVQANPVDTTSSTIDLVASNYNTSRYSGKASTGIIKITVATPNNYRFPVGVSFLQPGLNLLYSTTAYTVISPTPSADLGELQLFQNGELYYFLLPVSANNIGISSQVSSGAVFTVQAPAFINDFVKAEAYGNFSSGLPADTDKQLVAKIKKNLGSVRFESSAGIANNLSQAYPSFQGLSACGAGAAEMTRYGSNALNLSTYGKADIYVRTTVGPEQLTITKTGTKLSEGVWNVVMTMDDAPGFYSVSSILPAGNSAVALGGSLVITSTDFNFSYRDNALNNDIPDAPHARFSRYQTASITFNYVDPTPASSRDFLVTVLYQPHIGDIQDLLLSDSNRLICADYLVKAVVPCFVSLEIPIVRKRASDTYTSLGLDSLKQDIFNYVNTLSFEETLYASKIIQICHNYDISRVDLPITMTGNILCPDGTSILLSDSDLLAIPNTLASVAKGISPKTTQYFINYYKPSDGINNPADNIGIKLI